jgi:hypothetical protein
MANQDRQLAQQLLGLNRIDPNTGLAQNSGQIITNHLMTNPRNTSSQVLSNVAQNDYE